MRASAERTACAHHATSRTPSISPPPAPALPQLPKKRVCLLAAAAAHLDAAFGA